MIAASNILLAGTARSDEENRARPGGAAATLDRNVAESISDLCAATRTLFETSSHKNSNAPEQLLVVIETDDTALPRLVDREIASVFGIVFVFVFVDRHNVGAEA